ncbi:MAG: hypothetical protein AAGB04_29645, partial [Pseudomonadota bacterium]
MASESKTTYSIFTELRRRRVVRTLAVYVALAWAFLEISLTVLDRLGAPTWIGTSLIIVFIAGFPLVTLASWLFDIEDGHIRRTANTRVSLLAGVLAVATLGSTVAAISVFIDASGSGSASGTVAFSDVRTRPLTTDEGYEFYPAISGNGSLLAYSKADESTNEVDVYFKPVDGGVPRRIKREGTYDAWPIWSSDGTRIAFFSLNSSDAAPASPGHIVVYSIVEDKALELIDLGAFDLQTYAGLDWSPDEEWFVFTAESPGLEGWRIFLASALTGELLSAKPHEPGESNLNPRFSPDGEQIAFLRTASARSSAFRSDLCLLSVSSLSERCLAPEGENWNFSNVDWLADSTSLIGPLGAVVGARQMVQIDTVTGALGLVAFGVNASYLRIARGTNRMVAEEVFVDHNIWRYPGPNGDPALPPQRIINSTRDEIAPRYSPDGNNLAFMSSRSGNWEIWLSDSDGRNQRQLTQLGFANFPNWSPDGRSIGFSSPARIGSKESAASLNQSLPHVYEISLSGSIPKALVGSDDAGALAFDWSVDGTTLYFNRPAPAPCGFQLWRRLGDGTEEFIKDCLLRPEFGENGRMFVFGPGMDIYSADGNGDDLRLELPLMSAGICTDHNSGWTVWQ